MTFKVFRLLGAWFIKQQLGTNLALEAFTIYICPCQVKFQMTFPV